MRADDAMVRWTYCRDRVECRLRVGFFALSLMLDAVCFLVVRCLCIACVVFFVVVTTVCNAYVDSVDADEFVTIVPPVLVTVMLDVAVDDAPALSVILTVIV